MQKILIANRGEIVIRVARTARAMGVSTVAVFSDADRDALHVSACDDAIGIGGSTAAESYLVADKIISAARQSGADAIHPGYGFLSENARFAALVAESGLTWIGPPPSSIEAMGDKARARIRMAAAGVPIVPGYDGDDQSPKRMRKAAADIGFPVMIKASAGGGGRGMRVVHHAEDFDAALKSAANEAANAFGNPHLILEKAVQEPRHVEIQVFADSHGNIVHLGERDCSVQRRHQKVIEEAPSPAVSAELRAEMGACAIRIARQIGYRGAGTVEFLLDRSGAYYFMEMNTRLQVEHPVTELVTGHDLVDWQLRVARGEPLPVRQEEIEIKGWAIEARLCAEEPGSDYTPASGSIIVWRPPAFARCDAAIAAPSVVSPFYDSMLGKVIVAGPSRAEACARLANAIAKTILLGVSTNRVLLHKILQSAEFKDGNGVSTAFLPTIFPTSEDRIIRPKSEIWALAAWLSVAARPERGAHGAFWRDWTNSSAFLSPWRLRHAAGGKDVERRGAIEAGHSPPLVRLDDEEFSISGSVGAPCEAFSVAINGMNIEVAYGWVNDSLWLWTRSPSGADGFTGDHVFVDLRHRASSISDATAHENAVFSPLNGKVVSVDIEAGSGVKKGQRVAVMEAMKMEHTLLAPRDGIVSAVHVKVGDQVKSRHKILELEAAG